MSMDPRGLSADPLFLLELKGRPSRDSFFLAVQLDFPCFEGQFSLKNFFYSLKVRIYQRTHCKRADVEDILQ